MSVYGCHVSPDADTQPRFNLRAYFHRIGLPENFECVPTLHVLRDIVRHHTAVIVFENVDVFFARPVYIDVHSVFNKIVVHGRGGYCFEQNVLLWHVLREIGFQCRLFMSRVYWMSPPETPSRTHGVVHIFLPDGSVYLVDAGFGSWTLTQPLQLRTAGSDCSEYADCVDVEQSTSNGKYRLVKHQYLPQGSTAAAPIMSRAEEVILNACQAYELHVWVPMKQAWKLMYIMEVLFNHHIDFHSSSYYVSHVSAYTSMIVTFLNRPMEELALFNTHFRRYSPGKTSLIESKEIQTPMEMYDLLQTEFGIRLDGNRYNIPYEEFSARVAHLFATKSVAPSHL